MPNRSDRRDLERMQRQAQSLKGRATSIVLLYCHPGTVTHTFMESCIRLLQEAMPLGLDVTLIGASSGPLISRARNMLLERYIVGTRADYALFADTDVHFAAADVRALVDAKKPIVSPVYYLWDAVDHATQPVGMRFDAQDESEALTMESLAGLNKPLAEAFAVGMGLCLIRRDAAVAVARQGPLGRIDHLWPFAETAVDGKPRGEDVTFCMRARAAGHRSYLMTDREIGHTKLITI